MAKAVRNQNGEAGLLVNSLYERQQLGALLGLTFDGERDIYKVAGYPRTVDFPQYLARYQGQDIAHRIVKAPVVDTWNQLPVLVEGHTLESASPDTPTAHEFLHLYAAGDYDELGDLGNQGIWPALEQVDLVSGIGRYGVLLVGFADGGGLETPLRAGSLTGKGPGNSLLYLNVFDEAAAKIKEFDENPQSPRFTRPLVYTLTYENGKDIDVHWSRVIHVAEGMTTNNQCYGMPRLQAVYNRLLDIEKIMAASGEAAWALVNKGILMTSKEGYEFKDTENDGRSRAISDYLHGLRRSLELEGVDAEMIGGEVVDPSALVELNISLIAATMAMPQRILLGSERGELASSMDEVNWERTITARRNGHVNNRILFPLVSRLIYSGAIAPIQPGNHLYFRWPDFGPPDPLSEAKVAQAAAAALKTLGIEVDPLEFCRVYLPKLSQEAILGWFDFPDLPEPGDEEEDAEEVDGEPDEDAGEGDGEETEGDGGEEGGFGGGEVQAKRVKRRQAVPSVAALMAWLAKHQAEAGVEADGWTERLAG